MATKKLSAKSRRYFFSQIETEVLDLRFDRSRRFRNALLCIASNDKNWMIWVQENLPAHVNEIQKDGLVLVESRARALTFQSFRSLFSGSRLSEVLFKESWPFSDDGHLTPG